MCRIVECSIVLYVVFLYSLALEPTSQFVLHSVFFSDMRPRGRRSAEERGFACLSVATCSPSGHVSLQRMLFCLLSVATGGPNSHAPLLQYSS